jgi:DNA-directed RNA polymerase specialized sigma24 family protein
MNTNIQDHYTRLLKYCARQFKDQNCEDTVGDFVVKVLTKERFYPESLKDKNEEWAWTKSCFYRFKIDKLRSEKVRSAVLNTYGIASGISESDSSKNSEYYDLINKNPNLEYLDVPEAPQNLTELEYVSYISFHFPDEILEIYLKLTEYEKRVFQLSVLCRYGVLDVTKHLKETQTTTKRDVMLALKRIKESLRRNGGKDYEKYTPTEFDMYDS